MNNGAFGENFPYSNFHDLNMDWIIKIAKDFLDQYTHIQETIDTGLEELDTKATELETLLQDWYDTHSEDIADQLANALDDLNNWYNLHQTYLDNILQENIQLFDTHAEQKAVETIASIPEDYTVLSNDVDNLKNAENAIDLVYQQGYYRETDGEHQSGAKFICSVGYVDTSVNKLLEIFNSISTATSIFISEWKGNTFFQNKEFNTAEDLKHIRYVTLGDVTKVYINIMSSENITPADGEHVLVTSSKYDSSGYEIDYDNLTWDSGYIDGTTGKYANGARFIRTRDYIRINEKDVLNIKILNDNNYYFYITFYDTNLNYIGTIPEDTKAFEVTDFNGYIKVVIHSIYESITPATWNQFIKFYSPINQIEDTNSKYIHNYRNYISQQDYFEMTYDHTDLIWFIGAYVNPGGVINTNANASVTGLLRVMPNTYYQMNAFTNDNIDCVISYYNEDAQFIGRYDFYSSKRIHLIPENCHYIRINVNKNYITNFYFVRANHLADTKYLRNDNRIFISRWYENRYSNTSGVELLSNNSMFSDYITIEGNKTYKITPYSPMYTGYYGLIYYDTNKNVLSSSVNDGTSNTFTTPSNAVYLRVNADKTYFKEASCFITKIYSKSTDSIDIQWQNGYYSGDDGTYHNASQFLCTTTGITTSALKTLDIYKESELSLTSIFISLFDSSGFVKNISYDYNLPHIRYNIPSNIITVKINVMTNHALIPTDAENITVCISNDSDKEHFNIVDYVNSNSANSNYLLKSCSSSNTLPIGLDYDVNTMQVAFNASDVSADINSRGLDAPCVFWDSIMHRWGMTFTGYREDSVSEYGSIYSAHSDDLINWVQDGVIIERNLDNQYAPDYGTVGGSYVFIENGKYYVYYNGGSVRGFEAGNYTICLATGTQLSNLVKHTNNPILIGINDGSWYSYNKLYRPSVIKWGDGTYYMFLNARNTEHSDATHWHEYLGFATSKNLIDWELQDQILDNMPERQYDHFVTGDPCFYDIGDEYVYSTVFTCFNETGINWNNAGIGIMRTTKKNFPYGWELIKNTITGHPKDKAFVVYKNNVQYAFMDDTSRNIWYRTANT